MMVDGYVTFTVEYLLSPEEQQTLADLLPAWQAYVNADGKRPFADWGIGDLFAALMQSGSMHVMAEVFRRERERQAVCHISADETEGDVHDGSQ